MDSIIIPPPDIREAIEATCRLVVEGGKAAELRIVSAERNNPKYSFLNQNDPYHPYYLKTLTLPSESSPKEPVAKEVKAAPPTKNNSSVPLDDVFIHKMQYPSISAFDLDILRLTALFVAANEPAFVSNLVSKELRNPQFDFLKIDHSLNPLYKKMSASYEKSFAVQNDNSVRSEMSIFESIRELSINELSNHDLVESDAPASVTDLESYDWNNFVIGDILDFHDTDVYVAPITIDSLRNSSAAVKHTVYEIGAPSAPVPLETRTNIEQYVVCPLCKGSILSSEFEKHFRLETISASSSVQKKAEQSKYQGVPLETSSEAVKRNLSSMLGVNQTSAKKRK